MNVLESEENIKELINMRRTDKVSVAMHCKIDKQLSERLAYYSRLSGLTKTAIVERALEEFLSRQMPTELRNNFLNHT